MGLQWAEFWLYVAKQLSGVCKQNWNFKDVKYTENTRLFPGHISRIVFLLLHVCGAVPLHLHLWA
jgi:hypothetical protein